MPTLQRSVWRCRPSGSDRDKGGITEMIEITVETKVAVAEALARVMARATAKARAAALFGDEELVALNAGIAQGALNMACFLEVISEEAAQRLLDKMRYEVEKEEGPEDYEDEDCEDDYETYLV